MEKGRPTIIRSTSFLRAISIIASKSAGLFCREIMFSGLANMPSGSLKAKPILASPTSSPKVREISTSRLRVKYQLTSIKEEQLISNSDSKIPLTLPFTKGDDVILHFKIPLLSPDTSSG